MSKLEAICERVEGYTPGPMKSRAYLGGAYAVDQVAPNGDRIVHCAEVFGSLGRSRATAELFAAAPDLLRIATEQTKRIEELETALREIAIGYGTDEMRICAINALADTIVAPEATILQEKHTSFSGKKEDSDATG